MSKAKQLLEAIYKVYNPQEEIEEYGQEKPEFRRDFDSEDLRKQFIGTILTSGTDNNPMKLLKDCIEKMSDDWVAEFLKVINGDVVEQVNESITQLKYFTFKKDNLKTCDDFKKAQEEMKKALREEPNMDAQQVIKKDMETLKSWEQETIQETLNKLDEIKVTPKDVLDAKQRFEKQIEETTQLIERIKTYGSYELQQRAYDNVTAQLKVMDKFLNDLYNETIGE